MEFLEKLKIIENQLRWLDVEARSAIRLKETFCYAAYDNNVRDSIKKTNKVDCYNVCLHAIYFNFIMALARIFDSRRRDDVHSLNNLFRHLTNDFINEFEKIKKRQIKLYIGKSKEEYKRLKGTNLVAGIIKIRVERFAHNSLDENKKYYPKYGDAEELLDQTLNLINCLSFAIWKKKELYEYRSKEWRRKAQYFWDTFNHKPIKDE
ncbi:hypothetical protein [Desulfobacula sp.]|uniref:AbiU2 domain-containing protein n=1 Tax=Desulfobacula sp. TaxID=2593537 RepID=UPI0025C3496E|nr:hypothetical protein [Desulfobacula sp.]MBC2704671.1 hypothetical protein [Desulfobacula sp.]